MNLFIRKYYKILTILMCFFLHSLESIAGDGNSIRVLPDSTQEFIRFEISRIKKAIYTIQLIDEYGTVLYKNKELIEDNPKIISLSWKNYKPGIYFVKIENKKEQIKLMFIKKQIEPMPVVFTEHPH